jgi:indoleacetamide hydrolase
MTGNRHRPSTHTDWRRRILVFGASAASALGALPLAAAAAAPADDLIDLSATEAVTRMKRGDLSAASYAGALLRQCAAGRALNAYISFEPERVLETARELDRARRAGGRPGPLFGLPIPVKDSLNTRDYPTTAGTPALRRFRPAADAPLVKALRAAGAIVLGKTNLHELSWGWTSNNLAYGAVHNPYDPSRIPGGSSGGTAAAVAARMAPLGVAEDTEGSIRVPAALCGIMGFRPTTGRYPTTGCVPISTLFDQVGPHARTVGDLALFDSVVANDWRPLRPPPLHGVRLGVVRDYWYSDLDPEVERLTESALKRLEDAGVELVSSELPGLAQLIELTTDPVQNHDVRLTLARYLIENHTGITFEQLVSEASPDIRQSFRSYVLPGGPNFVTEEAYAAAIGTHRPALQRLYRDYFQRTGVAAVVFPVTLIAAPLIASGENDVLIRGRMLPFEVAIARNIAPGSTAGLPGLVLPAALNSAGLPVALELDGPSGSDRALLALGQSVSAVLGAIPAPRV